MLHVYLFLWSVKKEGGQYLWRGDGGGDWRRLRRPEAREYDAESLLEIWYFVSCFWFYDECCNLKTLYDLLLPLLFLFCLLASEILSSELLSGLLILKCWCCSDDCMLVSLDDELFCSESCWLMIWDAWIWLCLTLWWIWFWGYWLCLILRCWLLFQSLLW